MRTATRTRTASAACLAILLSVMSATAALGAPAEASAATTDAATALPAAPAATHSGGRDEGTPPALPAAVEKPAAGQPAVERGEGGEGEKAPARNIRFQFAGVPFATVVRRFASMADKPLIGDLKIEGDLTFFDSQPYTFNEAFDTLNLLLSMRGFWLVEKGRHLQLVPVSQLPSAARFVPGAGDAEPRPRPGEMVTMVVPLKFLDADTASKLMVRRVSPYGSIGPLPTGRGLAITDRFENIRGIRKFLSHFDKEMLAEHQFRMVVLKKAKASQVAGVINALMKQILAARRMIYAGRKMPPPKSFVTASHDNRTNMLVLAGSGEKLMMAEQLIASLDVEVDQPGTSEFRVFQLKHARARDVAVKVGMMLPRTPVKKVKGKPVGGQLLRAKILPDPATNRLLVSAPPEQMAIIEKFVKELDVEATVADGGARIFSLKVADASQLARVIAGAVRRKGPKGQLRPALAITSDPRTNSLVILGEAKDIDVAARLIKELDVEPAKSAPREIHVVQLKAGDARSLAGSLVRLFARRTRTRPRTGATALHVEAEPATNSLIISAAQADWPIVQGILTQLKASVEKIAAPVIRLIPLKFAKADELAGVLRAVSATRYRGPARRNVVPVQISPFPRGNSLLISAAEQDQQILADLIRAMDVEKSEDVDPVRIIRLESADPEELVTHIKSMLPRVLRGRRPEIFIQADKASRSVLLRAPESRRKEIEDLIAKLDASRKLFAREIRMLAVRKASAKDLAAVVSQMYPGRRRVERPWWERSSDTQQDDPDRVIVTASPNDKLLIVDAPKRKIEEIVQLVASLDIEGPARMHVRTYALGQSNARDLARSLGRLFSRRGRSKPQPRFEADTATGQLIVAATDEQFEEIDKLVASLAKKAKIASKTQRFPLKHVKASDIVPILRSMMIKKDSSRRDEYYWWYGYEPQQSDDKPEVKIAALPGDKSIIVKGPQEALAMAGELIAQLDTPENSTVSVIRIVRLKNARARSLARSVNTSLRDRSRRGKPPKVTVTAEDNSNSVLVRGPIAAVPPVLAMIKELDADSSETGIQIRIYPLKNTDAVELSESIGRLFRDVSRQMRRTRRDAPAPPFSIAADERTNSLIVSTSASHFAIVEELLANLDKKTERPDRDVEYVVLKNADAFDVAGKLRALFRDRRRADQPVIEGDFFTNTLTLIGREQDLRLMRPIIDKIEKVSEKIQVRVVPLTHMNAARIAETIKRLYGQMSDSEIIIRRGAPDKGAGKDDTGGEVVYSVSPELESPLGTGSGKPAESDPPKRPIVTIAVDTKSNALILSGPRQELDNIESLIAQLMFTRGEGEAEIRIFELKQADPMSVAQILERLFNPRRTVTVPQPPRRGGSTTQPVKKRPPIKVPPPSVTIATDLRTRSLIIRAKPADFEIIAPLIKKLDTVSTVVSELRVFALKNTDAAEAAANLNDLFRLSAAKPAAGKGKPQQQRAGMIRKMIELRHKDGVTKIDASALVSISANRRTNSVIVSAPPDAMKLIGDILSELDQSAVQGKATVRMYPLKNAEVSSTVAALQQIFAPRRRGRGAARDEPVLITGDEAGRVVIISAPAEKHEAIAKVVADLDAVQGEKALVKVYRLRHAEARPLAAALSGALGSVRRSPARRGAPTGGAAVRINADRSSNCLVVRASKADHEKIARLIGQMDVAPAEKLPVQIIPLKHADPAVVAQMLRRAFAPVSGRRRRSRIVIEADRQGRTLMVRADAMSFEKIRRLVARLDATTPTGKATQTLIPLKHAQAASVAASLAQAFAPPRGRRVTPDDLVKVVAEPISNSIIVTANAENLGKIKGLLKDLDTETAGGRTELLLLRNARATDLAAVLSRVAAGAPGRGRRGRQGVIVSAEAASNALVMTGPAGEIDKLMKMAQQLDQASVTAASRVYIIPLTNGSAVEAAAMVRELYRQQTQAARRERKSIDPLAVSADERANAVIVATGEKMYKQVSEWIRRVDAMKPSRGVPRIIHLKHADPAEIKKAIDELFGAGSSRAPRGRRGRRNPRGRGGKVEATVLAKQRALLVNASQEDYEAILKLVEALDKSAEKSKRQVKVFALKNAVNTRVAAALNAMYRAARSRDPRDMVSVSAPARTSAVIVLAAKEKMEEVAGLIAQLDAEEISPQLEFRIYVLNHAQPTKILPALRQMLRQVQRFRPGETIDVQADERTRSIIVTARKTVFDQVGRIIETLDRKPAFGEAEVLIIPLRRADATRLAEVLNQMLRPSPAGQVTREARALQEQVRRLRVRSTLKDKVPELDLTKPIKIASDPARPNQQGSNCLIISSTPDNLRAMRQIVQMLDTVPVSEGVVVRVLPLTHADALSVMKTLREVFSQGRRTLSGKPGTSVAGKAEPAGVSGKALTNPLNISADLRTNTVIISGIEETAALAEVLVKRMDVKLAHPAVQLVVIPLKHNDAGAIAPMIRTLFQARLRSTTPPGQQPAPRDRVDVTAESLTNSLIVSASGENLDLIRNLLKKLDVEPPAETGIVRLYPLINSDAQRVAGMLKGLISQGLYKPGLRAAGADRARAARERVAVEVDVRTNVLVVSASRENFAVIEEIIRTIDATKGFGALGGIRLYTLKRADATRLAPTLQQFFNAKRAAEQAAGASGRSLPTGIIPDARTNTLLVAGSRESFAAVEEMIKRLDAEKVTAANVFRVFRLKRASAAALQETLDKLLRRRVVRGRRRDQITIVADQSQNVLIVGAGAEDMKIVESLVTRLDGAPDKAGETLRVFPLQKADATQVAKTLRTLYQARGAAAGITIGVDERINAIVVSAGGADLQRIGELIERLDSKTVTRVTEIRVFVLLNADATELAKILTDTLTNKPKPLTAVSPHRQTLLQFVTQTVEGRHLVTNALQEGVLITPDARTNSLVVAAPVRNMPLLARLIEAMDSTAPRMAQIRVFTLKNADARSMADVLTSLFRSGTASAAGPRRAVEYKLTTTPPGAAAVTVGTAEQDALNITVDSRTNSLLIGGTRRQVEMAASVIEELDSSPAQERMTKVYRLRNARAGDVQAALRGFLDQERQRLTSALGTDRLGAAHRLLEREVAIVAVAADGKQENSNTLLLSASPRYFKTISKMIDELDQPPPQVLIKVLLAEVKLQDETDLGFEWNHRKRLNGKTVTSGANFGVQAAIAGSGSGLSVSVTGSDINMFLRALKAQGRLQILQRPQIMAADNKQGRINIGQRVPFITNSRVTEGGTTLNTIQYEDVGINLTVTPRINPDGFVKLDIDQKIESLSTSTVRISQSVNAVIVDSRTATTTVSVQDGHTIIIGGIITTKDETQEAKVPFLGDIPLLGGLFRSTKATKERSELLIILTPQVLRGIPDADAATAKQLDRLKRFRELGTEGTRNYLMDILETLAGSNANEETWEALMRELKKPATQPATQPSRPEALPLESLIEQDKKDRQDKQ